MKLTLVRHYKVQSASYGLEYFTVFAEVSVDMRNHLIHAYFNIDLDIVWDTVTKDLPSLITSLEKIIPPEENQ